MSPYQLTAAIAEKDLAGVELRSWIYFASWIVGAWVIGIIASFLLKLVSRKSREGSMYAIVVCSLAPPVKYLIVMGGVFLAFRHMSGFVWYDTIMPTVQLVLKAGSIWLLIWFLLLMTSAIGKRASQAARKTETRLDDMLVPILTSVVKFLLIAFGVLLIMQNLGYSVTSLIAGLGIGGAAIALASKDTVANIFGSLVVFLDRPFELGDWVKVNNVEGSIEEIRLRTTLIRTSDKSLITMPNALLTNTSVDNYTRRSSRRMDCSFALSHSTKASQAEGIVQALKAYLEKTSDLFTSSYWVSISEFTEAGIQVRVIAYSHKTDSTNHLEAKQVFLLAIMRIVEEHGASFGYPMRGVLADEKN